MKPCVAVTEIVPRKLVFSDFRSSGSQVVKNHGWKNPAVSTEKSMSHIMRYRGTNALKTERIAYLLTSQPMNSK